MKQHFVNIIYMSSITLLQLCDPALFFLFFAFFDFLFIVFVKRKNKNKTKNFNHKIKIFLLLFLCGLGWTFIINSICEYEKYIAWTFAAIPLIYLSYR